MGNLVAIVGRPNVGKSTLFNRLTETKQAIISDEAGTTRDRQYGRCLWCGKEFSLVDTGGWVRNSDDVFEEAICEQVTLAMEKRSVSDLTSTPLISHIRWRQTALLPVLILQCANSGSNTVSPAARSLKSSANVSAIPA